MAIAYRGKSEIEHIRRAGLVVMEVLSILRDAVRPGVTTGELDALARRELAERDATSNFKGYRPARGIPPFPGVLCASVNDEIVHGIPGPRILKDGDIIALDMGAIVDGWHGDSAITVPVGAISPAAQRLLDVTQEALRRGIAAATPGNRVLDIARAVQTYVEGEGYSVVRQYGGHGIGRALHEEPFIPHYIERGQPNPLLRPGMTFCIEPMVNAGGPDTRELPDRWTVATADGSLSAHFEHTIAITHGAPDILTTL
ncbi:MAG: Methionine aminopeptidase [Ktedonobacterales bacterium]|jgi:methionyl aminopeptidase|nr:MAG: Methionine aminopeptidase [Ktedonobacterales bacterium]